MRSPLIAAFVLFLAPIVHAQTGTDSLLLKMKSGRSYDERIKAYINFLEKNTLSNFETAIEYGNDGLNLARAHGDSISIAALKRYIGMGYYFSGKYTLAAANYYDAINILEKFSQDNKIEKKNLALVFNELAKLYRKTRDLDRSLENYNKAMLLFQDLDDSTGIALILNESGVVFEYKKEYAEAIRRYEASLEIAEALHDSLGVSYSLSFIAGVETAEKKYDAAEKKLLQSLSIRQRLRDSFAMALAWADLGATYNASGKPEKAMEALTHSNFIAKRLNYPELQSGNLNEMSLVAEKNGNYQQALKYFRERTNLQDSLFGIQKTKQIEELNAKYETVKKEQIISEQQSRIRQQNLLFVGVAISIVLISLLAYSQYKRNRLRQETLLKTELMKQQEQSAKAVLEAEEEERQRIAKDLHDGVGQMMSAAKMNLSALESEIKFSDKEQKDSLSKIIQLVDESCKEVRQVSHSMMPNVLMKKNLAAALTDFIDKLDKKKLKIHFYSEGLELRLDSNVETVLYRVIQESVNNVLKHSGATELDISVTRDNEGIHATIEDNGRGFDTAEKEMREGIGLKNITTRVEYLKGTVDFDSAPGRGTVVGIFIPLTKDSQS